LTSLDATFCPGLKFLHCYHNNLSELNVTGLTQLGLLNCKENEQLTEIPGLYDCTKIYYLECSDCSLTTLDLRYKDDLQEVWCRNNHLTILTVNGKPKLTTLVVGGNELLANLQCYDCALTNLEVFGCTALSYLDCNNNQLTELDVTTCPALRFLNFNGNQLTELDISNNSELEALWCNDNQLTSLDMSRCSSLFFSLDCRNNNISGTMDLSRYSKLYQVICSDNQISQLILGEHHELIDLWCSNNQLTSLDISGCSALEALSASYNQLTSLGASGLSNLIDMYVQYNQLTSLKVDNCRNLVTIVNFGNCIKASQMGQFVNGLPTRSDNQHGELYVDVDGDSSGEIVEGNVITVSQVNQAVAKNWNVYKWNWDNEAWEPYAGSDGLPGDVNDDGNVTIADVTVLIDYLLKGGASAINDANADVNGDGNVTIADVTALTDMLLQGTVGMMKSAPVPHSASASRPVIPQNARLARSLGSLRSQISD
jgi:Leucine-rich repeat (LRR) protein